MAISDKVESPPMIVDGEELLLDATRPVHEPATGEVMAYAPEVDASHAEQAVATASGDWSRIAPGERAAVLDRLFELSGTPRKGWYDAVSKPR
jgi:acyl-CoA reductase-like NAD-dependent aldehyde dehydrogenase